MPYSADYYIVNGQKLPLWRQRSASVLIPSRNVSAVALGARLSRSPLVAVDSRPVRNGFIVRGEAEAIDALKKEPDVAAMRPSFLDQNGYELFLTDEILVKFNQYVEEEERMGIASEYGANLRHLFNNTWALQLADSASGALLEIANSVSEHDSIEYAEPNMLTDVRTFLVPQDDLFSEQWHLENTGQTGGTSGADINAPGAWQFTIGSPAVRIAILDFGVDIDHPDLLTNILPGRDFANNDDNPNEENLNHGTLCAGLAAARDNECGVIGVAPRCGIVPVRLSPKETTDTIADSIRWAAEHSDVVSCSLGFVLSNVITDTIQDVVANGRGGRGTSLFFAAGNNPMVPVSFPASFADTIAVGASTHDDLLSSNISGSQGSSFGPELDFLAPGASPRSGLGPPAPDRLPTTDIDVSGDECGDFTTFTGTSAATPLAAGTAALMLSVNAGLTADEVRTILRETADKVSTSDASYDASGFSPRYGYGRINAAAAVRTALGQRIPVGDGDFVVVWQEDANKNDRYGVRARGYALSAGADPEDRFQGMVVNSVIRGDQSAPSVAMNKSGDFVVVWHEDADSNGKYGIRVRGYTAESLPRFDESIVNTIVPGDQSYPDVAINDDGAFVVVWRDDEDGNGRYDIHVRGYDTDGNPVFGPLVVNTIVDGDQSYPVVAMAENGDFVIAWQDDDDNNGRYDIHARGYDIAGNPRFGPNVLNSETKGDQSRPAITMAADGSFVVAWHDDTNRNSLYEIHARIYDSQGVAQVDEILVNTVSAGDQSYPGVAMTDDGEFVVAWQEDSDDDGNYGIRVRGFVSSGAERFPTRVVNSQRVGMQIQPVVAIAADSSLVVAWENDSDDNGFYDIHMRGFTGNGGGAFSERTVNTVTTGNQSQPAIAMVRNKPALQDEADPAGEVLS